MLVFLLKLLLTLMLTSLCPHPQPQHDPPQTAAPIMTPAVKETSAAP